jgi:cytochrome c-type biogenesis protein CcmH/NrfG
VEKALATYRSVIESAGDKPQGLAARNRIAAVLVSQRKLDEASALISEVLKKNPRDNDALLLRGNLAMEKKDSATAITDLRAVLRDQPGAVPVFPTVSRRWRKKACVTRSKLRRKTPRCEWNSRSC